MSALVYRLSNIALGSAIALPELPLAPGPADWTFTVGAGRIASRTRGWFHAWRVARLGTVVSFARRPCGYLLRFHGRADFEIDVGNRTIVGWQRRPNTATTLRHLLLDQVMPLVLSRERRLVLHAAAVSIGAGAVAFVGPAGSGKSTLAAALAAGGAPLICDDCLVLEPAAGGLAARGYYPGTRLWPDSIRAVGLGGLSFEQVAERSRKRRIANDSIRFVDAVTPITRVFVLDGPSRAADTTALSLVRLRARDALLAIVRYTFQLDVGDAESIRRAFDLQIRLAATTPVYQLTCPWRLDRLGGTCDAVRREIEADR